MAENGGGKGNVEQDMKPILMPLFFMLDQAQPGQMTGL